jgi:hypothetical protein
MTHLTDAEFVDLLDRTLAPSREAHLQVCGDCRAIADTMREAFTRAAAAEMPEPSPLFWEHFSARVHEGVRDAESGAATTWFGWAHGATFKWALSGAVLTLLLVSGVWVSVWRASMAGARHEAPAATVATIADAAADTDLDAFDPDTDEAWALVRTVADDLSWDDAAAEGFGVRPGSADRAMVTLTSDERSELVRLLQAETKQPGA